MSAARSCFCTSSLGDTARSELLNDLRVKFSRTRGCVVRYPSTTNVLHFLFYARCILIFRSFVVTLSRNDCRSRRPMRNFQVERVEHKNNIQNVFSPRPRATYGSVCFLPSGWKHRYKKNQNSTSLTFLYNNHFIEISNRSFFELPYTLFMRIFFPNQKKTVEAAENTRLLDVIEKNFGSVLAAPCGGNGLCGKCTVRLGNGKVVRACQTNVYPEMTVFLETESLQKSTVSILTCFSPAILRELEAQSVLNDAFSLVFDLGTTTLAGALVHKNTILSTTSRLNPQKKFGADVISRIQYGMQSRNHAKELQNTLLTTIQEMISDLLNRSKTDINSVRILIFAGNTTMETTLLGLDTSSLASVPFTPSEKIQTNIHSSDALWGGAFATFPSETPIRIFPVLSGFVGGDITAGILATHLNNTQKPTFFLDLGTNGEMVLNIGTKSDSESDSEIGTETKTKTETGAGTGTESEIKAEIKHSKRIERFSHRLIACATAAGPCFEGARISCGMCAATGAITKIENRDGIFWFETFQDAPARGICGSALIDLTAELLRLGLLTSDGRLLEPDEIPETVPSSWASRVKKETNPETHFEEPVFQMVGNFSVTQTDFRELQLAAGAIRTGITLLLRRGALRASEIASFQVAGGFGRSVSVANAQRIGLIPPEISAENVAFVGNTSLAGAVLAACTPSESQWFSQVAEIKRLTNCIDLSTDPDFSDVFMDCMFWPDSL